MGVYSRLGEGGRKDKDFRISWKDKEFLGQKCDILPILPMRLRKFYLLRGIFYFFAPLVIRITKLLATRI